MNLVQVSSSDEVAACAAKMTIELLSSTLNEFNEATWVLSGGSTPIKAYKIIIKRYRDVLDWTKVWFLLGDERKVNDNDPLSNWREVQSNLLSKLDISAGHALKPTYNQDLNLMAKDYQALLGRLPKAKNGQPRLDLLWLGIGEDGHTLSLFPGRNNNEPDLVAGVTDSPKLPPERISLTLMALKQVRSSLILATGSNKTEAVARLIEGDKSLPASLAVQSIESRGGQVCLMIDKESGALIK